MGNQAKPDVNTIWSSAGLATAISKAKQALGWVAEIPEYDQFNGMLQQISQFQQHVNQEGVALWDALTTYGIGSVVKSPVDRSIYRALNADLINVPPVAVVGGAVNANWVKLAHTDAEIQALIGLYGVTAVNLQQQTVTAFTSAGVAPTFTLTPTPAIAAYTTPLRLRVRFNVAGLPGVNTLNVSGKGAVNLKQYNSAGVKIDAVITANLSTDVEYDGVDFVLLDALPPVVPVVPMTVGIAGAAKRLTGSATGLSAAVNYTADELTVENAANIYQVLRGVNISPSFANPVGANGLDAGVSAPSTWYYVWVIWNSATVAGLFSLSDTAPALPAGYTYKALVGVIRTDATGLKYPLSFIQSGHVWQYKVASGSNLPAMPLLASGIGGNPSVGPTFTTLAVGNFAPPLASALTLVLNISVAGAGAIIVVPNTSYGVYDSVSNPPLGGLANGSFKPGPAQVSFQLEGSNIYWAADRAECRIFITSFELKL